MPSFNLSPCKKYTKELKKAIFDDNQKGINNNFTILNYDDYYLNSKNYS